MFVSEVNEVNSEFLRWKKLVHVDGKNSMMNEIFDTNDLDVNVNNEWNELKN